jgi:hypothetical protein
VLRGPLSIKAIFLNFKQNFILFKKFKLNDVLIDLIFYF